MKLTGLMMVRNEAWVLGLSVRAALMWCDDVLVLDHASADGTAAVIDRAVLEFGGARVKTMRNDNAGHWDEMTERQRMLDAARLHRATHLAIIDGDEVLTGNLLPHVRAMFSASAAGSCVSVPMVSPYHGTAVRRIDGPWGLRSSLALGFADKPGLRWAAAGDGYQYHARRPQGSANPGLAVEGMESGGVFHLQFASLARLRAKAAWYKMVEVLRWPGRKGPDELNQMYDWTLRETCDMQMAAIPEQWWAPYAKLLPMLDLGAAPWQAAEAQRLWKHYGPDKFKGLALHGVVG